MSRTQIAPSPATVRQRLRTVTDPELDRSIVELDYVDEIEVGAEPLDVDCVEGPTRPSELPPVHVEFSLPTAWCSPAFAWMMAVDVRDVVEGIEGVERCTVALRDHMHAREITEGVNDRRPFEEVFADATEGIEPVREMLDRKALAARQYELVEALLEVGARPPQICALTLADCTVHEEAGYVAVRLDDVSVCVDREPFARYVEKTDEVGWLSDSEPLFRTRDGEPIAPEQFDRVHAETRVTTVNMRGQAGVCDALHEARYGDARPEDERYAWESVPDG